MRCPVVLPKGKNTVVSSRFVNLLLHCHVLLSCVDGHFKIPWRCVKFIINLDSSTILFWERAIGSGIIFLLFCFVVRFLVQHATCKWIPRLMYLIMGLVSHSRSKVVKGGNAQYFLTYAFVASTSSSYFLKVLLQRKPLGHVRLFTVTKKIDGWLHPLNDLLNHQERIFKQSTRD